MQQLAEMFWGQVEGRQSFYVKMNRLSSQLFFADIDGEKESWQF